MSSLFSRLFPIPSFFTIPTVGLDFSDATMRFIRLRQATHGLLPVAFSELTIPDGALDGGRINNAAIFSNFLRDVRKKFNLKYVRVSIPESQVYSFTVPIDVAAKDDIRSSIELVLEDNIPLKVGEAIFDYQVLSSDATAIVVQVVALSEKVAQEYLAAFNTAGLVPVSFELDGQASARAVLRPDDTRSAMIVDVGSHRTGITIVTNGTAVYTSTLDFGGTNVIDTVMKSLHVSTEEAHRLIHEYGLSGREGRTDLALLVIQGIAVLKDEIHRRYVYWHEKKDQVRSVPTIDTIYICGGYSNIEGLIDYLSANLKLRVVQVNPWINCLSFEHDIPLLTSTQSQSYVTAIGLALTDYIYD